MENQFSKFKSINFKEAILGLIITVGVALLDLAWQGTNPMIVHLQKTLEFDISLFTSKVNWGSAWDTASVTAVAFVTAIFYSGEKKTD
jgi:hypothetical protein